MQNSNFLRLNTFDFFKGLIVAVITGVLTAILQMLSIVPPSLDLKQIGIVSLTSAIAYLIKQLGTDDLGSLKIGGRPRRKPRKPRRDADNEIDADDCEFRVGDTLLFFTDIEFTGISISILDIQRVDVHIVRLPLAQNIPFNDFESIEFEIN